MAQSPGSQPIQNVAALNEALDLEAFQRVQVASCLREGFSRSTQADEHGSGFLWRQPGQDGHSLCFLVFVGLRVSPLPVQDSLPVHKVIRSH